MHEEWNWLDMCPSGITIWIPDTEDLAPCFQQICLQLPILVLIAIFSSYQFGRSCNLVSRNNTQIRLIYLRVFVVLALAFLPLVRTYFFIKNNLTIWPADILISCTETVSWIVHLGFLLSLRSHGTCNHRGSLMINILWISITVLSIVWLRTGIIYSYWTWSAVGVTLQFFYGLSLIPSGNARIINRRNTEEDERQALLGNTYIRFQDHDEEILGNAQDGAPILSKLLLYWVGPLIEKGVNGNLKKIDDLFDLPESLSIHYITEKLQKYIDGTSTLFRALHKSFGIEFYTIGILRLFADLSGFAGPILLGSLLRERSTSNKGTDLKPYLYAIGLFSSTLFGAFCSTHFNWRISLATMKMRLGLVTAIYRKTIETQSLQNSTPNILNLMSTDTDRIVNSCVSFHSLWSIPFQLFTTLYLLYTQIGLSFLAGVLFAITLIPINRWIALRIGVLSQQLMTAKDERVMITNEALSGAKQIKLNAWEEIFINKIKELRKIEIVFLKKRKYLDAICVYFWATTPVILCLLTFGVSVLMGNQLTAASTYTSVALLNMLIGPLNAFPWVLNGLTEAWVSLKRVQELINLQNIDLSTYYQPFHSEPSMKQQNVKPIVLSIEDGTFEYQFQRNRKDENLIQDNILDFKLTNVNLEIKKGELICIEGSVGSGKSSLLSAILGDLNCISGKICLHDLDTGFGYTSQNPWLQRGTIRDNILWGAVYDETRYRNVLFACALQDDLDILGGDHVGVGESGRTLSGGQRARVALARTVYQEKQIYIFDDILSSLDAHVASHVVKHCLLNFLKNKTRIIITEHRTLFHNANQILHIDNGKVSQSDLISISDISDDDDDDHDNNIKNDGMMNIILNDDENKSLDSVMMEETMEKGKLSKSVLVSYWNAMSGTIGFLVMLSVITMQVSRNLSDAWLAHWVSQNFTTSNSTNITTQSIIDNNNNIDNNQTTHTINYYLGIFAGLAITNSLLTLIRAFIFAYAGIRAAKVIHKKLLKSVFYTKFKFFDITPLGRIINRFSSDTYTIDDSLPFILNILLAQLGGLIGTIGISLYAMPWLGLLIVPLFPTYLNIQHRYRYASRSIKRLSSNAMSPIYAHFTETLQGLQTIRAMRGGNRFRRDFSAKLEESIRAQLTSSAAQQWLGLRLQLLGAVLVGGAGLLSAITSTHATNPSYVGLAISYALSITGLLGGVLNALAETEQELVAVERVNQYCNLENESNADGNANPPFGWPCQGIVNFNDVTLKYREHLPPALSNISFETTPCETIGIVGRTGAGKSTVLASLLRVTPVNRGTVTIDCINIETLSLKVLRNRIAVVPQEPFLFTGTIKFNLDPFGTRSDSEIWSAINNCLAASIVQNLGGLSAQIDARGSNLSAGQKQLLCLTRALLKSAKLVLIDEGTANLDSESEAAIQSVLKTAFKTSTSILIAHRLNGLQHVDRIFVMKNGNIVESGSPRNLGNNENSLFFKMLEEQKNKEFQD